MLDKAVRFLEFVSICVLFRCIVMLFCMIVSHYRWLHWSWTYQDRNVLQGTQTLKTIINERMNIIYLIQKRIMPFSFLSLFWYNKVQSIVCLSCFEISHSSNYMPILAHGKNRIDRLNSSVRPSCFPADFLPGACRTGFEVNRWCSPGSFRAKAFEGCLRFFHPGSVVSESPEKRHYHPLFS